MSLYVPEPARSIVDAVRTRTDPIQHELIPAHVTLCRDDEVTDGTVVERRLAAAGRLPRPLAPHITLRHPRNVARLTTPIDRDAAGFAHPAPIHFAKASLIEQVDDGPWRVIAVYPG
ncbi:MAG: hypothetical protein QF634_00890 [Vicinamibacterales bacterium]|nr:hypothetical protein [Vicinamibacterales bacterium]